MFSSIKKTIRQRVNQTQVNRLHKARAVWANIKHRFPSRGMIVIGVTGTKGKTTTCHFIASILREAGYKVGMVTTVSFQIGDDEWINNTNKSNLRPHQLQSLLRQMKDQRCDVAILEATSIGLDQHRLWGVPFRYVGLTNLAHDHLDYHKTWYDYQKAKLRLFRWKGLKTAVVNADDPAAEFYLTHTTARNKWSYSSLTAEPPPSATEHVWADKVFTNMNGASFILHLGDEQERVRLQLPGLFSVENALCAASLCANLNLKIGTIVSGLEKLQSVPGRLERIETTKGFSIIVDYAHTPDSLEKLYSTLRPEVRGRMIAVLGSCGDRDKTKRPIMGALAARFCDLVYVTDEEPYSEDPLHIIEEVAKGVPRGRALYKPSAAVAAKQEKNLFKKISPDGEGEWWWIVPDRRDAIRRAVEQCKLDDLILITGMGSQNFKIVNGKQEPWNDRQVVEEILHEKHLIPEG